MTGATPGTPSPDGPGKRPRSRSQEAILNAAIDMLREEGYHGLTVEGVASRAGASKATVYRWWPTKNALVVGAVGHRINVPPVRPVGNLRADLRAVIQAAYDVLVRSPLGTILPSLAVDLLADPETSALLASHLAPRRESVTAIFAAAVERGELEPGVDLRTLTDIYSGTILYRSLVSGKTSDVIVDQLTDLIVDGTLPRRVDSAS